jgi:thiol:disulfide interchange protein DsbD
MRLIVAILICVAALTGTSLRAAHTEAALVLSAATARPGDTIWAGVDLKMEPGWHTYWKNPGDSGQATEIKWQLPPGITAGEIRWPLPEKLPPIEVTTYGYENEVMLLVPLTLGTNLPAGPLELKANVSWLECKEVCIPAKADVQVALNVGSETQASASALLFEEWKAKVPEPAKGNIFAWWSDAVKGDSRPLAIQSILTWMVSSGSESFKFSKLDFYPNAYDSFEAGNFSLDTNYVGKGEFRLNGVVKKFSGNWPTVISGVLVTGNDSNHVGYIVQLKIDNQPPQSEVAKITATPVLATSLWKMLFYAFIGGLILNIMPCVLPVIALKILGFVSEAKSSPARVRALGGIYAVGVLFSFLALAAVVIGVKAAGNQAGWGMQFGNPVFLVCLTTLVMLVALNLFGVFEVILGGRALGAAGELASRHGAAGAFFNGVLATVLATPCTAPFLSIALGFAFAQSAAVIVAVFLTVGLGLASPYVLLCWNPAWLKFLPKPGAWMEKFKIAMGFPMLATVVWLFNVAGSSYGKNVLWLGVFLVVVAFAAWIFGEFVQRGRTRKTAAAIVTALLLIGGYLFALEKELDWRAPITAAPAGSLKESANGIDWQPWSSEAVTAARAAGKPVLVDFTADWCLTCQVNKKTSLEVESVRTQLKTLGAVALLGDYTHFPAAITTELQRFNRAGVPLVLVYPKNPDAQPIVLPEVLTPGIVLDALERANK